MKNNERGGIISKIIFIPVALVLVAGFFFLGYFVGKYPSKSKTLAENLPPMPEVVSKNIPKPDEFTFYKTLTDKNDKTVSIDLKPNPTDSKPKATTEDKHAEKKHTDAETAREKAAQPSNHVTAEKKSSALPKQPAETKKKDTSPAGKNTRPRYTLQISAYQEKSDADADVKRLKQRGYAAFILPSELPGKGTWYRVRLGSFSNRAAAEKLQREVREKEGLSPFVTVE